MRSGLRSFLPLILAVVLGLAAAPAHTGTAEHLTQAGHALHHDGHCPSAIITRTDLAKDHPDQVKKFTGALLKGLQDTYDDPAAAAAILKKYVPQTDVGVATQELVIMKDYIKPPDYNGPLGAVDLNRVKKVISLLDDAKAIQPAGSDKPEDVVTLNLAPKA